MLSQEKNWVQQPKGEGGGSEGDYNATWSPQEMPVLEGVLIDVKRNVGKYTKSVYVVKTGDGKIYDVWEKAVLKKQLDPMPINSYIKIEYLGMMKGAGNSYHDFNVFVAGEQAPVPDVANNDPGHPHPPAPVGAVPVPVPVPVAEPAPVAATPAPTAVAPEAETDLPF